MISKRAGLRFLVAVTVQCAGGLAAPAWAQSGGTAAVETAPVVVASAKPVATKRDIAVEKRIADLHHKFAITSAQEGKWAPVAQAMRDNSIGMQGLIKDRTAHAKTMTAVEDLQSYEKLAEAHEAGLKTFLPLFEALYDSLSEEQKKSADVAFRTHEGKMHHDRS